MSKRDCISVCHGESCVSSNMIDPNQHGITPQTDSDWQGVTAAATTSTDSKQCAVVNIAMNGRQEKTGQEEPTQGELSNIATSKEKGSPSMSRAALHV